MKNNIKLLALTSAIAFSSPVLADADFAVGTASLEATTNVNLEVKIPAVLVFKVGDKGDTVNTVTWDYTGGGFGNNQTYNGDVPVVTLPLGLPIITDDDSTSAAPVDGILNTYIYNNAGTTIITVDKAADLAGSNSGTIPVANFAVNNTANVAHPAGNIAVGNTSTIAFTAGTATSEEDTWEYVYTATTSPVAGTYTTTVTYKATSL